MTDSETRIKFTEQIYDMFANENSNDKANTIIDLFDELMENCIELPCNIGDTVYFIKFMFTYYDEPKAEKIRKIEIISEDSFIIRTTHDRTFSNKDINKTVFLDEKTAIKEILKVKSILAEKI